MNWKKDVDWIFVLKLLKYIVTFLLGLLTGNAGLCV